MGDFPGGEEDAAADGVSAGDNTARPGGNAEFGGNGDGAIDAEATLWTGEGVPQGRQFAATDSHLWGTMTFSSIRMRWRHLAASS